MKSRGMGEWRNISHYSYLRHYIEFGRQTNTRRYTSHTFYLMGWTVGLGVLVKRRKSFLCFGIELNCPV